MILRYTTMMPSQQRDLSSKLVQFWTNFLTQISRHFSLQSLYPFPWTMFLMNAHRTLDVISFFGQSFNKSSINNPASFYSTSLHGNVTSCCEYCFVTVANLETAVCTVALFTDISSRWTCSRHQHGPALSLIRQCTTWCIVRNSYIVSTWSGDALICRQRVLQH